MPQAWRAEHYVETGGTRLPLILEEAKAHLVSPITLMPMILNYTLEAGTEGESGFIMSFVTVGDTVVMSDYEGEDNAYGVGQLSGNETLDAIRAAETWLGVPEVSTPVGMLGYSGGAVATEFASELAPTYAPHLDIVGVAEGGIPVDLFHNLTYIDTPASSWTGQIPSYLDGLARGLGVRDLDSYFTLQGIAAANADQTQCSGTFTGLGSRPNSCSSRSTRTSKRSPSSSVPLTNKSWAEAAPRVDCCSSGMVFRTRSVTGSRSPRTFKNSRTRTVTGGSRSSSISTTGKIMTRPVRPSLLRLKRF